MTDRNRENRPEEYIYLVMILLLLGVSRLLQYNLSGFANDDCYITFRYAKNIADGNGFVYNLGERVLGTTTPLWAIIIAMPGFIFGPNSIPAASMALSLSADIFTIAVLWRIGRTTGPVAQVIAMLFFLLHPKVMQICGSGMEASLVVGLMVGSFALLIMNKRWAGAVLLGFLLLTRFDGIIWVSVLLGWQWRLHKSPPWKEMLIIAIVTLPWILFSQFYFGSVVPQSLVAKTLSYHHLFPAFDPIRVLTGYLPFESLRDSSVGTRLPAILLMLTPVVVELVRLWRLQNSLVVWPAFFLIYSLVFSFARVILHDWYFLPGFVAYFITCSTIVQYLFSQRQTFQTGFSSWCAGLAALVCGAYLLVVILRLETNVGGPFARDYEDLARYFSDKSSSSIFVEPIGFVGWLSNSYIHDPVGIVSPAVTAYRKAFSGSDQWWISYVRSLQPDYVVLRMEEIKSNALYLGYGGDLFSGEMNQVWFQENYGEVTWLNRTAIGFFVYRKRSLPRTDFASIPQFTLHRHEQHGHEE